MFRKWFYVLGILSLLVIILKYEVGAFIPLISKLEYLIVVAFIVFIGIKFIVQKRSLTSNILDFGVIFLFFLFFKRFNTFLLIEFYLFFTQFFLIINVLLSHFPSSHLNPAGIIFGIFLAIIGTGTLLLLLPGATYRGISFIDALFTATSATCVTGLIVVDTGSHFTLAGQLIILFLIQIGGLGIITFSTFFALMFRGDISISERVVVKDYLGNVTWKIEDILKNILIFTLAFEGIGALFMWYSWRQKGVFSPLYNAVFHAISAFCNAGFSLFRDNLAGFQNDLWINLIFIFLIVSGGLGFLVIYDIANVIKNRSKGNRVRLSLHSKIVLITTAFLIGGGFLLFFLFSKVSPMVSLFQVVSARTAGFNTINLASLNVPSIFLLILLMVIGASPGSTGGGIKTSTFTLIILYIRTILKGKSKTEVFHRTIPHSIIEKAFVITILYIFTLILSLLLITWTEPKENFLNLLFEVTSAIGTVGYSLGATPNLHFWGKLIIIINMIVGRIGPLTIVFALRKKEERDLYSYPEEKILVG